MAARKIKEQEEMSARRREKIQERIVKENEPNKPSIHEVKSQNPIPVIGQKDLNVQASH